MIEQAQERFRGRIDNLLGQLNDFELTQPPISPRYSEIAASLLVLDKEGVRAFNGGPFDFRGYGIEKSWLVPAEVEDHVGWTNFHILYLNCTPSDAENVPVTVSYAPELGLKVGDVKDKTVGWLHRSIMGGDQTPRIIVRPSLIGSLYYPKISTPLERPSSRVLVGRMKRLVKMLNLQLDTEKINVPAINRLTKGFSLYAEYPQFFMAAPRRVQSEAGFIYVYSIVSPDDPWKYFQLFTDKPLEKMDKRPQVMLRTDSGCDVGQLYRDMGCDCRDQLITALKNIHRGDDNDLGGIVIHIPTQDGRGYGMNTKMETEGLKKAERVVFNRQDGHIEPLNTVQAAEKVFGNDWDPRTFDGTARILVQIGFKSVIVYTDNKEKVACLRRGGLEVEQRPTGTKGNEFNSHHIRAKHRTDKYFPSD